MDLRFVYGGGRLLGDFSDTEVEDTFEELRNLLEIRNMTVLEVLRVFVQEFPGYGFEGALNFWREESEIIGGHLAEVHKFRKSSMNYKGNLFNKKEIRELDDADRHKVILDTALVEGSGSAGIDWFLKMDRETSLYQKSQSWIGLGMILLMHVEKYAELKFMELVEDVIDEIVGDMEDASLSEKLYSVLIHRLAESEVRRVKERHNRVRSRMKKLEEEMVEAWSGYDDVMIDSDDDTDE